MNIGLQSVKNVMRELYKSYEKRKTGEKSLRLGDI